MQAFPSTKEIFIFVLFIWNNSELGINLKDESAWMTPSLTDHVNATCIYTRGRLVGGFVVSGRLEL